MIAKSFEWRGYAFEWCPLDYHPHAGAEMSAHYSIWKGSLRQTPKDGPYVGCADTAEEGMKLCRAYAAKQLHRWQVELAKLESVVDLL